MWGVVNITLPTTEDPSRYGRSYRPLTMLVSDAAHLLIFQSAVQSSSTSTDMHPNRDRWFKKQVEQGALPCGVLFSPWRPEAQATAVPLPRHLPSRPYQRPQYGVFAESPLFSFSLLRRLLSNTKNFEKTTASKFDREQGKPQPGRQNPAEKPLTRSRPWQRGDPGRDPSFWRQ
jgi:hypothetical protein